MPGVRASLALVALSAILGSVAVARGATPATSDGRTRMTERVPSLKKRLEEATKDLTYTSETDAPVEPFEMKGFEGEKVGPADLLAFLKRDASTPVADAIHLSHVRTTRRVSVVKTPRGSRSVDMRRPEPYRFEREARPFVLRGDG